MTTADREPVLDALRLAELWLDEATSFPSGATSSAAWSRAEWVEATLPAWRELVDPVAGKVVDSMGSMLGGEGGPLARWASRACRRSSRPPCHRWPDRCSR